MKRIKYLSVLLFIIGIGYYFLSRDFKKNPPTLYYNGTFITLDSLNNNFNAMFVANGKIIEIGNKETLLSKLPKQIKKVNLEGKTVLPGFIDPHTHFALSMFLANFYDLSGFKHKSNKEVWDYLKKVTNKVPKNKWIFRSNTV